MGDLRHAFALFVTCFGHPGLEIAPRSPSWGGFVNPEGLPHVLLVRLRKRLRRLAAVGPGCSAFPLLQQALVGV